MPTIVLSICVAAYDRAEPLAALLEHLLFTNDLTFSAEIVVSHEASSDEIAAVLESYRSSLPLRTVCQRENIDVAANSFAALRESKGRYALSLADDGRIDPAALERVIEYLCAHPDVVMLNVPTLLWDEAEGAALPPAYALDEPMAFGAAQGLDCFNFLVDRTILPEVAIYQSKVVHKLLLHPYDLNVGLVMVFRALHCGQVCFHPDSYCRSLIRKDDEVAGAVPDTEGLPPKMPPFDKYRGALETSLMSVLQSLAPLPLPADLRQEAMRMINDFLVTQMRVSIQQFLEARDFITAHELHTRSVLWRSHVTESDLQEWDDRYLVLVALQSTLKVLDLLRFLRGLVVCGFVDTDKILPAFELCSPKTEVLVRGIEESLQAPDRDELMYLVEHADDITKLTGAGVASGHIVCLSEVMAQYRILPRQFFQ